jgi:hypothetical protein
MAWLKKGNRKYYYRSRRVGDRVYSEYVGAGFLAELIAEEDQAERLERKLEYRREMEKRRAHKQLERQSDEVSNLINSMVQAAFLVTGHHTHKRQWRKRKNE